MTTKCKGEGALWSESEGILLEVRALFVFRWIVAIVAVGLIVTFAVLAQQAAGVAEGSALTADVVRNLVWALVTYLSANLLLKVRR